LGPRTYLSILGDSGKLSRALAVALQDLAQLLDLLVQVVEVLLVARREGGRVVGAVVLAVATIVASGDGRGGTVVGYPQVEGGGGGVCHLDGVVVTDHGDEVVVFLLEPSSRLAAASRADKLCSVGLRTRRDSCN
jgi:hypothetical protein